MRSWSKGLIVTMFLCSQITSWSVRAQEEDSAPQEAPFVQEENEFEEFMEVLPPTGSTSVDQEMKEAQGAEGKTEEKPREKTVDLNEQVPEAGPVVEELPPVEEEVKTATEEPEVVPAEPVVEAAPAPQQEKVFRRTTKGGVEYIQHPQAANGLLAITREGAYIYRTNENQKYNQTGTVRFGSMDAPKIVAADGTTFETMYSGAQHPVVMFDYEWQPFTGFGKLGVQAGFGFLYASGQGRFVSSDPALNGQEAKEKYTFLAIPLNAGVVYRLEFMSRQWLAPYVAGGGSYIGVTEFRDDGKSPSIVGTPGAYGAAGAMLNISAMDRETAFTLNSEYGIANLWVSVEFRHLETFNEDLDFSSNILSAGITVDY